MRFSMLRAWSWLVFLCLFGCGGSGAHRLAAAIPAPDRTTRHGRGGPTRLQVFFGVPGEKMTLDVRLRGLSIGRMRVAVGQPGTVAGRPAIVIKSVVESTGLLAIVTDLFWELTTTLDTERSYPISAVSRYSAQVGGRREQGKEERGSLAGDHLHNLHSMVGVIRGWDPAPGQRAHLRVRVEDRFRVDLVALGREYSRSFQRPTLRIEGVAHFGGGHPFTVLVTDDASRVPLRVDMKTRFGVISTVLVRYSGEKWQWPNQQNLRGVIGSN